MADIVLQVHCRHYAGRIVFCQSTSLPRLPRLCGCARRTLILLATALPHQSSDKCLRERWRGMGQLITVADNSCGGGGAMRDVMLMINSIAAKVLSPRCRSHQEATPCIDTQENTHSPSRVATPCVYRVLDYVGFFLLADVSWVCCWLLSRASLELGAVCLVAELVGVGSPRACSELLCRKS